MNKFQKNLGLDASEIRAQRGKITAEETAMFQEELVKKYQAEKRKLDLQMLNLCDVSPDNTYSLRPAGPDYKPEKWVLEMQSVKVALLNNEIQLSTALATQKEWFTDGPDKKA